MNIDAIDAIIEGITPVVLGLVQSEVAASIAALPAAKDGKDFDPELLRAAAHDAVAGVPAPVVDVELVRMVVAETLPPLVERAQADLAERIRAAIEALPAPKDGDSVTVEDVEPMLERLVGEAVAAIPRPENGTSVTTEDVMPIISAALADAVAAIPAPRDGNDADMAEVERLVLAAVDRAVAQIPPPKNGEDASPEQLEAAVARAVEALPRPENGKDADPETIRAIVLDAVAALPPPKPGKDAEPVTAEDFRQLFEAEYAKWQLEWERRANDRLDRAVGALRAPQDGFSLEDFSVEHDGDGNVTLRFARGELVKEFALRLPRFKDRGVYRDDEAYREGDGVSYSGSFWIAQKDDPQGRPDAGTGDFRLAVKRGRDGKDGVMKAAPVAPGPVRV